MEDALTIDDGIGPLRTDLQTGSTANAAIRE
jgi:hypothetical protein